MAAARMAQREHPPPQAQRLSQGLGLRHFPGSTQGTSPTKRGTRDLSCRVLSTHVPAGPPNLPAAVRTPADTPPLHTQRASF